MFSDIGTGPSIVQNERGDDPRFLNTAWTIQIVRGVCLFLLTCACAVPFAWFYEQPLLIKVLPVAGLTGLIAGFNSTKLSSCSRHLRLARLTMLDLTAAVTGLVVMIAWASISPTVWALVAGGMSASTARLILSHAALPYEPNRFAWDRTAARSLFRFGRWVFLSTLLTFCAVQADRLVFGRLIPLDVLGVYSIALMIATAPTQAILKIGSSVVFPVYSRAKSDPDRLRRIFDRTRLPLLCGSAVLVAGLIATGPALIRLLWTPDYEAAGWMLQWLAVGAWFRIVQITSGSVLLALGKAQWVAAGNAAKVVAMIVLIPLGFSYFSFAGGIAGFALADVLKYLVTAWGARRAGLPGWRVEILMTSVTALLVALGLLTAGAVERHGGGAASSFLAAGTSIALVAALGMACMTSVRRSLAATAEDQA
jgi:O-antigen/teichoic acid export membrane protein